MAPKNLLSGSFWVPRCTKFEIWGHQKVTEKWTLTNVGMYRKWVPKWVSNLMQMGFFWTPISNVLPKSVQGGAWHPKSSIFHPKLSIFQQNLTKQVIQKQPTWVLPFPFSTFEENLWTPTWPQVSQSTFSPFPSEPMVHFLHFLRGALMSRR